MRIHCVWRSYRATWCEFGLDILSTCHVPVLLTRVDHQPIRSHNKEISVFNEQTFHILFHFQSSLIRDTVPRIHSIAMPHPSFYNFLADGKSTETAEKCESGEKNKLFTLITAKTGTSACEVNYNYSFYRSNDSQLCQTQCRTLRWLIRFACSLSVSQFFGCSHFALINISIHQ